MRPLFDAHAVRASDQDAIERLGISGATLMERAGRAIAEIVLDTVLRATTRGAYDVVVVAGAGGNGGDGFVVARILSERSLRCRVLLAVDKSAATGDAKAMLAQLDAAMIDTIDSSANVARFGAAIENATVVVDALFGVGLARDVTGHFAEIVERMNGAPGVRVAVDVPSGINASTGAMLGIAVDADVTVTVGVLKVGLLTGKGASHTGQIEVVDIGTVATGADVFTYDESDARQHVPRVESDENKGGRGHVFVVAGMPGFRGAGRLSCQAALRAGAGLVTWASVPDGNGELTAPDTIMTLALSRNAIAIDELARATSIVFGPGLGRDAHAEQLTDLVLALAKVPVVIDADALLVLAHPPVDGAHRDHRRPRADRPLIVTPHPKEAATMLGTSVAEVERDRVAAARAIARRFGAVVVLKGAGSVVCDATGTLTSEPPRCTVNTSGSPALATGGSGDVLAGVIGALLAQGLSPADAARLGVFVHGRAGEALEARIGARGGIASDLFELIALELTSLRHRRSRV